MQHLGCSDWACVEANFQEGGRYSGLWGWLDTLIVGEDGDTVVVDSYAQLASGQHLHVNGTGQFTTKDGHIYVTNITTSGNLITTYDQLSDNAFAQLALTSSWEQSHVALYRTGGFVTIYNQRTGSDCVHHDCVTQGLDAVATASSLIGAGCTLAAQPECAAPALLVSTTASGVGFAWTGVQVLNANASEVDLAMAVSTLTIGAKSHPYVAFGASAVQWAWDAFHPKDGSYK